MCVRRMFVDSCSIFIVIKGYECSVKILVKKDIFIDLMCFFPISIVLVVLVFIIVILGDKFELYFLKKHKM